MDYLNEAFGGFAPHLDTDAAVKFVLNVILMDDRLDELALLLTEGHDIGGIEGDPGWILERRDLVEGSNLTGYTEWPDWARFRAFVDSDGYELAHPEFFMDKATFYRYALAALQSYVKINPGKMASTAEALAKATSFLRSWKC